MTTAPKLLNTTAAAMVKNDAVMPPIDKLVADTVKYELDEAVKYLVLSLLFSPSSGLDLSPDESLKDSKTKAQKERGRRR